MRYKIIALLLGIVFSLIFVLAVETGLRYYYEDPGKFVYSLSPAQVEHSAIFKRSFLPHKTDASPRVFCLGGSTTHGNNMPYDKSYPILLQGMFMVNNKQGTAYNYGVCGMGSVITNCFIHTILPQYKPDCVVIHDGYNDIPIIVKKTGDDRYQYVTPDYLKVYNPYISNPLLRYIFSFIKFNFRAAHRWLSIYIRDGLQRGTDVFLGFDYRRYPLREGLGQDVMKENDKRMKVFLEKECDSIDFCLQNGIKVIVIMEPYIKPHHYDPAFGTGLRDENTAEILAECHKAQQSVFYYLLLNKYKDNKNVIILDMRELFKDYYVQLFYDEFHMNRGGNSAKAQLVYAALNRLFP